MIANSANEINIYKKIQSIIAYPATIVPALSEETIRVTLIEAINAYIEGDLHLGTLIMLATKIERYMGIRKELDVKLNDALTKIIGLSIYLKNQDSMADTINDVLVNILNYFMDKE